MATETAMNSSEKLPIPSWGIWLIAFAHPIIGGAIMYYAWRRTNPVAAKYANRASFVAFGFWVVVGIVFSRVVLSAHR
jgi:hypothetical protein